MATASTMNSPFAGMVHVATPAYMPGGMPPQQVSHRSPIAQRAIHSQVLGSVVGRHTSGITTLSSGNPSAHSIGHYGKGGLPGLDGGDLSSGGEF